jgi:hypothetical protein
MTKLKADRRVKQRKSEVEAPHCRRSSGSSTRPEAQLLALQQTLGNQGVSQLLQLSGGTELNVSRPGDTHEQEADRIAQSITQPGIPADSDLSLKQLGRPPMSGGNSLGPGKPLPGALRSELEPRFGYDLSSVRIHENEPAAESARSINASAYTVGTNVVFGHNQFAPQTTAGKQLLAHELTHVVRQTSTSRSSSHVAQSPGLVQRKEDWDFTRKDYAELTKKKGALKISSDSSWFPSAFQENLLNTLNFLFDPTVKKPGTEGVNIKDLYHGHVGFDKTVHKTIPKDVSDKREKFEAKQAELYKKALGDEWNPVTAKNIKEFTAAEEKSLPLAGDMLTEAAKSPTGVVVVYHTFESSTPSDLKGKAGLKMGDPRRNFLTPLDTNKPAPFSAPDPDNASSWMDKFWSLFQFSFLVDEKGEVHVRTGSTKQLSSVTGTPLS